MNKYFEIFLNEFANYFNYVSEAILNPSGTNFFYWLIGISIFFWVWEIVNPWRDYQPKIRKDFWLDGFYMFFNFFIFSLIGYHAVSMVFVNLFNDFLHWTLGIQNMVAIY
ncbi:MAG: hypothetical protein ABEH43_11920, partial [Flavobacteriales bacterium]